MPAPEFLKGRALAYADLGSGLLEWADQLEQRQGQAQKEEEKQKEEERKSREDRTPLSPREWIANSYFACDLADTLYPKIKDVFTRVYEEQYHEVILAGATRYGKTSLALPINGYALYLLSCMGSPQRNFRKMAESVFLLLNMNITELKARSAYFAKFSAWVKSTPYFTQEFAPRPGMLTQLQFPKNLHCRYSGASANASESEDLVFFLGDEANLYDVVDVSKRAKEGTKFDAAEEIDHAVSWRMNGTFMQPDGSFPAPCKIVWLCKETYPNSFLRRKIADAKRSGLCRPGKTLIVESTEWGMKPEGTYEKKYFYLRTASRMESERILRPDEVERVKLEAARLEADPKVPEDERFKVFEVPEVHRKVAEDNIGRFIRDGCGWPTESVSLFLRDRSWIKRAVRYPGQTWRKGHPPHPAAACRHPFRLDESTLLSGDDFIPSICHQVEIDGELVWRPIINPNAPRYIHLDAGLTTDPMGFAMSHQAGWTEVERYSEDDNAMKPEVAPLVYVDAMLRIVPEPGRQISFGAARNLIRRLRSYGFLIAKVTMDSWQHVALDQPLIEEGFEAEVVSVDKTMDAYDFVEKAFAEGRISFYDYLVFVGELSLLERVVTKKVKDGRVVVKVDHRPGERKDVCDAVAGTVWQIELAATQHAPMQLQPVASKKPEVRIEQAQADRSMRDAFERGDFEAMCEAGLGERLM